ncbi:MAG: hypothetical protein EBY20_06315 [Alphaproteobacteria bacterium]|nr:hypothetical protein [Alphaproteobacteria bacterium]
MQISFENSLISKNSMTNIISDQEKILDTMIQLIETVKSLNLLSDETISKEKKEHLRNFLYNQLNEEMSKLQENIKQKNQYSEFNKPIQNILNAIIKLVKAIRLLSDKNIFFDQKELLNTLLQEELNNCVL